jgi:hypothetical protein
MKWVVVLFLTLNAVPALSQMTSDEVVFIEKIIRLKKTNGNIVYTNHISPVDALRIRNKLKSELVYNKSSETNSLVITKHERKQIEKQLELLSKPYWSANLFKESKMIDQQNVNTYFKDVYNQYSETLTNPNNSQLDKSNLLKETPEPFVFEFTPPLYLRDKSLCIVYMKTLCGVSCGGEELTVFKKQNEKWEKCMELAFE